MLSNELLARCKAVLPRLSRALTFTETNALERVHDFELAGDDDDDPAVDTRRSMLASRRRWKPRMFRVSNNSWSKVMQVFGNFKYGMTK